MSGEMQIASTVAFAGTSATYDRALPADVAKNANQVGVKNAYDVKDVKGAEGVNGAEQVAASEKMSGTQGNEADTQALIELTESLTDMMTLMRKGLEFRVDETQGAPVVSVMDMDSGELIRQIPTEEALALAEKMSEIAGVLMKTEA
ncbi:MULTISPECIES: flagellar protein FlaG [unclassified Shewanella]|uniref:flagellar protein FlaG n=1 Tax=unclassified Shewanella TaxID=196818 RepID=UPI0039B57F8A